MPLPNCGVIACPIHGSPSLLDYFWIKHNCQSIDYFGLGFIQVKINAETRMHFYTYELEPVIQEEEIHNHRYDFRSDILRGYLTQHIYSVQFSRNATHKLSNVSCSATEPAPTDSQGVLVNAVMSARLNAGSHYTVNQDTFHRVESRNAVTFLHRGPKTKDYAQVVRKFDAPIACPFSKKIDKDKLWSLVRGIM